jgi:hypothetical protein
MRLLVIGGSDAGISAGLRARELDPTVETTLGWSLTPCAVVCFNRRYPAKGAPGPRPCAPTQGSAALSLLTMQPS